MKSNWADLQRKNNSQQTQSVKAIQEANQSYNDRENKVNGFAGSASQILSRFSPANNTATMGGGGTTVGA